MLAVLFADVNRGVNKMSTTPRDTPGFVFVLISFLVCLPAASQTPSATSDHATAASPAADARPVVVELFTSEGCSSCPPADLFLQKLDKFQPIQGAQLIVLSEHVTYWDQQGWKDPNSFQALTDRQSSYESALGEKESFTPQVIVDGDHELKLEIPAQQIKDLLQQARDEAKVPVQISAVALDPGNPSVLRAHVDAGQNSTNHNAEVYLAVALSHVESQVLRGENGGHHLEHVAVVQKITKIGKLSKGKTFADDVQLKLTPTEDPKNLRVIAFVQESGPGKILGAALLKLPN
jgi:hypothetical protein